MASTKWWKCDLQVATPAWEFRLPAENKYDLRMREERARFLDDYMAAVRRAGVEVIAIADHNTGEWIDDAKAAGLRHGVIVFPGCEITTHTGSDGVHLIILGDPEKTSQDFDRLIHGCLGFDDGNAPFLDQGGTKIPGTSSRTLIQILDDLPDGYLAIAPHALNDNGVASAKTIKGDMRWRALHHERLVAIDPGDCSDAGGESFGAKLRRRELTDFPRLRELAYISTSDAYSLDAIGTRFTWLRMGQVSIEALRQAFLDHESRVLCDWSPVLAQMPGRDPNNVRHAWVRNVQLDGRLGNSTAPLHIPFHSGLNVLIGGRGSGKSSVVAALRQLYSSTNTLPRRLKEEADSFVEAVFSAAHLSSKYKVQESQEEYEALWTSKEGSTTLASGQRVTTAFPVTVISQKELFERAAGDKNDPNLSSRSLFALVDSSLGYSSSDVRTIDSFGRRLEDARVAWANAVRSHVLLDADLAQLPSLRQQAATLQGQVDAFSSDAVKSRLSRIEARRREGESLHAKGERVKRLVNEARLLVSELMASEVDSLVAEEPFAEEYSDMARGVENIAAKLALTIESGANDAESALEEWNRVISSSAWKKDVVEAEADLEAYKGDLEARGLSPSEFSRLQQELGNARETIRRIEQKEPELDAARAAVSTTWQELVRLLSQRREARAELFHQIESRSGRLRFKMKVLADTAPWIEQLRTMSGFRADAFIDDVAALAAWLWTSGADSLQDRWREWRGAMATADLSQIQRAAKLRPAFAERLGGLEDAVRLRLATIVPDDVVVMEFLKEGGRSASDEDWQSVTQGSPGQRTAAMLAFVLHHGREPLVLDQPEDDLDSEWISKLVVKELRQSRWHRQLIVVSHNANIPVLGDAEQVIALENVNGALRVRCSEEVTPSQGIRRILHVGPVEDQLVRNDIQSIMEGGVAAFVTREQKYNNETRTFKTRAEYQPQRPPAPSAA